MTTILSIQSSVAYGHVGNSAATFPLMRMGVEVWPVLTVHFSNHTGYGQWRGPLLAAADVADVIAGIDDRGVLGRCDAVLSGYQGAADMGAVVLEAVELVRSRNPAAVYCCDPVMGDVGRGMFVRPGIPELMRDRVVPAAQVITPNQFELEFLTGRQTTTIQDVLSAVDDVRALGPTTVLVTSVVHSEAASDTIDMVAVSDQGAWSVTTPLLPRSFQGAGDLTAATFLAHLLRTGDVARALAQTAAVVHAVLTATLDSGESELQLVAAQDEIAQPTTSFEVTRLT
ncbi:MAG TPA: pyridoxal kinase PdxY [Propionibacteriaceae bacterium]|nr:pyridoxal kinase PdxY [Propionibacteriaceae bacterium]